MPGAGLTPSVMFWARSPPATCPAPSRSAVILGPSGEELEQTTVTLPVEAIHGVLA